MIVIYQCENCGETFEGRAKEKIAKLHEKNCRAKNYGMGDRIEVLYNFFDGTAPKWLKGTVTTKFKDNDGKLCLVASMDKQWYDDTDLLHNGRDMKIPNDGAPSISKNVRRLVR